ncbi:LOB domain-containing protein 42-like [Durio zibethinus]|uniref:LOB domain-containing protein 42-like n=1 Tax=Durio zibethinus TaxID=66656 RepID=A0A6P5XEV5_DURZI|nr:LOB domain-containing protein 42-like [Durio zibethinus]
MRMSCNGCRILRKGCSESCIIRPCLQWIKSPDSQANATLFLAKFYGRAGLLNLIEAGPENLRPAIFRSLLYEACGRVVNPVYGSVGMLWSGNWAECQAAVDAVLEGSPITQTSYSESLAQQPISHLKTYDIRHVSKDPKPADIGKVKTRTRFKRSATRSKRQVGSPSNDSWMSQFANGDSKEDESMFSGETVEGSLVNQTKKVPAFKFASQIKESTDVGLELTLGLAPAATQLPHM